MKTLVKWAFRLFIVLIVLLVAAILLFDTAARAIIENAVSARTGLEVKIGSVNVGLLRPRFIVENAVIYNPAEFGGSPMLKLDELHIEYDRSALREGKLHLDLLRVNLAELSVIQNKEGRSNFDDLKTRSEKRKAEKDKESRNLEFNGIDTLNLSLGTVKFVDMRNQKNSREFNLGVEHEVLTDLKTQEDVQNQVLSVILRAGAGAVYEALSLQAGTVKPRRPPVSQTPTNATPGVTKSPVNRAGGQ